MKRIFILFLVFSLSSCAELQQIAQQLPQEGPVSNMDIANGLKQALNKGIDQQVSTLTEEGGFFRNELVRISLPPELQKVDRGLRSIGFGSLVDEGLIILNRAAEDAVKEATPIFVNAVREMTFTDAKNILMGPDTAATEYLSGKTTQALYSKFNPVVQKSLDDVGATEFWANLINKYNDLPLTSSVNPDLADYVTDEALEGVFTMIAVEEKEIRNNFSERTTSLLKQVFALQD